jgi:hypothetical protein
MESNGILRKMKTELGTPISYRLSLNEDIELNGLIGKKVTFEWTGIIICSGCNKTIKKSFGDGFCFNCFSTGAESSPCIIRPELCRAHLGEGRDVEWELSHHNVEHVVYLAATDAIKVGVTRSTQVPTRWIDQGAAKAIVFARTPNRYEAGRLEVALKSMYTDKTNWQKMLKNEIDADIDLVEEKWNLYDTLPDDLLTYFCDDDDHMELYFPVSHYPKVIKSTSLDKIANFSGELVGVKGQYLIFNDGTVFNIRRHTGYEVSFSWS